MSEKKYPNPIYAAAGAGDYAYQQFRKLREQVNQGDRELRTDLYRLRDVTVRQARSVLDDVKTVYADLIARGERVVERNPKRTSMTAIDDQATAATSGSRRTTNGAA